MSLKPHETRRLGQLGRLATTLLNRVQGVAEAAGLQSPNAYLLRIQFRNGQIKPQLSVSLHYRGAGDGTLKTLNFFLPENGRIALRDMQQHALQQGLQTGQFSSTPGAQMQGLWARHIGSSSGGAGRIRQHLIRHAALYATLIQGDSLILITRHFVQWQNTTRLQALRYNNQPLPSRPEWSDMTACLPLFDGHADLVVLDSEPEWCSAHERMSMERAQAQAPITAAQMKAIFQRASAKPEHLRFVLRKIDDKTLAAVLVRADGFEMQFAEADISP